MIAGVTTRPARQRLTTTRTKGQTMDHERTGSTTRLAAVGAAGLLTGVAIFQVALAAGGPWGANVYGGRAATPDGVLPAGYRIASLTAAPTLSLAAWVLLARAGVVSPGRVPRAAIDTGSWAISGYLAINTVANLASTSAVERWGLGAVTALAAALAWQVARSPAAPPSLHEPSRTEGAWT
jgi:hypothetical protein